MLRLNGQFNINTSIVRGDKSISHRALIFAAVSFGSSVIRNLPLSRDVLATINCLRALGANISLDGHTARVEPITEPKENAALYCENSGTTARLLAGLVAGLGVKARFYGDGSLSARPMRRVLDPLEKLGAKFKTPNDCLFESCGNDGLVGSEITAQVNSAQVKSAVLIAGLFATGRTAYIEKVPTRNHTELLLQAMGANIRTEGLCSTVEKSQLSPLNIDVPRDVSSVAFLIAADLVRNKQFQCDNLLLNERRTGFLRVLKSCGADIEYSDVRTVFGEKVGHVAVKNSLLKPLFASASDVCDSIDELLVMGAIALAIEGAHVFEQVSELKHKESDRIKAIQHMAQVCGQRAEFDGENLTVVSNGKLPKNPRFMSFGDHRVAMAEAVLCLAANGGSVDKTPFDVSFPEFTEALGINEYRLGLIGSNVENSRSPFLMEYLATQANVACSYDAISLSRDVSDSKLLNVISRYDGLNVTMPFKRRVASLLKSDCCSANTVCRNSTALSTDGYGIVKALKECNVDMKNKPLWVVGAGGAATVCVETLLEYGCKIQIINRTQSHADELTRKYGLSTDIAEPYGVLSFVPECEFEQGLVLPASCKFVFVAAYKGQSGLKDKALARGITYVDGLRMLYHQGAKSFSLWTDTPLQDDYASFEKYIKG